MPRQSRREKRRSDRSDQRGQSNQHQHQHQQKDYQAEEYRGGVGKMDLHKFRFLNYHQELAYNTIMDNTVTLLVGCPGTAKTLISLAAGVRLLQEREIDQIIYLRSDVPTDHQRSRGSLPGTYAEKARPLMLPLLQNLKVLMPQQNIEYLMNKEKITVMLLEDVLGSSFNRTFIIFDEAQHSMPVNVRGVLTRVGVDSKVVVAGDSKQINYHAFRGGGLNGLDDAVCRLNNLPDLGIVRFNKEDVVRNGIIPHILERYEDLNY